MISKQANISKNYFLYLYKFCLLSLVNSANIYRKKNPKNYKYKNTITPPLPKKLESLVSSVLSMNKIMWLANNFLDTYRIKSVIKVETDIIASITVSPQDKVWY
jgi:hypothetical protein